MVYFAALAVTSTKQQRHSNTALEGHASAAEATLSWSQ